MKRYLLFLVFAAALPFFLAAHRVLAVELPERINQIGDVYTPKVLSDSPWYILKEIRDQLKILLATDPLRKAYFRLELANKKTLELQQLCEIGKCRYANSLLPAVLKSMERLTNETAKEKERGKDVTEMVAKIEDSGLSQAAVLSRLFRISPPEQKDVILKAKEDLVRVTEAFLRETAGFERANSFLKEVATLTAP